MNHRSFGNTGLKISELVIGGGAVGGLLIDADDETRRQAVRLALDAGVNWIDTAANYGQGRSEKAVNWLLRELPADRRPHVSTKLAFDLAAGDPAGQAERAMTESLERLGTDSVTLYQVHNQITAEAGRLPGSVTPDDMLRRGGIADAMQSLVTRGFTKHIGITATGETEPLREVIRSRRFESAQIYYNLLNPSAGRPVPENFSAYDQGQIIDLAAENGMGVMVIRVLAAGVIATDRRHGKEGGVVFNNDVAADEVRMRKVLPLLAPEHGTRSQVACRYALRHPGVSCIVFGFAELGHLGLALEAFEMGPLPQDLLARLDQLADTDFA